ncbi:MAG: hypothetical protein V3V22_02065 [Methylococcales bacterium]
MDNLWILMHSILFTQGVSAFKLQRTIWENQARNAAAILLPDYNADIR